MERDRPLERNARVYVAGAKTLIGAAIIRELDRWGYAHIVGKGADELDLTDASQIDAFFSKTSPEYVFLAAGSSGGIRANQKYPAELMLNNLLIECNVIHNAHRHGVKKLLYLASSCSYPKNCSQPMKEDSLLSGPLEPTNEAYAIAKIAGIKLCQAYYQQYRVNFICGIPANAFGPGDDFDPEDSHVVAGLIRRMHEAKLANADSVEIWGTGTPRREFIFVDDLADACIFVMNGYDDPQPINLGTGTDRSIRELASLIKDVVGYKGSIRFDANKPDGMPVKLLDSNKLSALGWRSKQNFKSSLDETYRWFLEKEDGDR